MLGCSAGACWPPAWALRPELERESALTQPAFAYDLHFLANHRQLRTHLGPVHAVPNYTCRYTLGHKHVYLHMCRHTDPTCTHVCTHILAHLVQTHLPAYTYIHTYMFHTYLQTFAHTPMCTHTYTHIDMHVSTHMHSIPPAPPHRHKPYAYMYPCMFTSTAAALVSLGKRSSGADTGTVPILLGILWGLANGPRSSG